MLKIQSYIKKPFQEINNLNEVITNPLKFFVEIQETQKIRALKDNINFEYCEGCIVITLHDQVLLGFELWDLIDQLWSYFLNLVSEYIKTGSASFYFPDQPVKLKLEELSKSQDCILLSIEADSLKKWKLSKKEFISTLLNQAEQFFIALVTEFKRPRYIYQKEFEQIDAIRSFLETI